MENLKNILAYLGALFLVYMLLTVTGHRRENYELVTNDQYAPLYETGGSR